MHHKPFPGNEDLVTCQACPVCGGNDLHDMGEPVEHEGTPLHYDRCENCNLIFMNPRPTQSWYNHLYQAEFWEVKNAKENTRGQVENQIRKEAQWAEKFIALLERAEFGQHHPDPQILEIGCAYGLIGKLVAKHFGGTAFGVEPNDEARKFACDVTRIEIFGSNMDELIESNEEDRFDLIIFSHVLENIVDPVAALGAARRLLKDNGLILIDTPNNFFRKSWHVHHPYCFTLPALDALLAKSGLKITTARTWSRPKYLIGPVYLSVLASKSPPRTPEPVSPLGFSMRRIWGHMAFSLFNRGPVAGFNRRLALRAWSPGRESAAEVERVLDVNSTASSSKKPPKTGKAK